MSVELTRTFASLPQTTRGQTIALTAHPKGKTFLYCYGNYVIIRDLDNPSVSDVYSEHSCAVLVAKYSPTTFYIASADKSGKIRIWDTTQAEHILKNEFQVFAGPIRSLDWDSESKRICVAGEGRTSYVSAISWDTGTSLGEMAGHTKAANSIAYKPTRPFRIVSGGEDFHVCFYEGPPFKMTLNHANHKNFVNCVAYAPSGEFFVSGGADGQLLVFDGKSGAHVGEIGAPAHKGGIYGISFSQDSQSLVSVSADKTVKIWATANTSDLPKEPTSMFAVGATIDDMQVSCVWARPDTILTVSLSGTINFFDPSALSDGPRRRLFGHNKPVTAMTVLPNGAGVVTASSEGRMAVWNTQTGDAQYITGDLHSNQVQGMTMTGDGRLLTIGFDDTLRTSSVEQLKCGVEPARKLPSQPKCVASAGDITAVGCIGKVQLLKGGRDLASVAVSYEPLAVAISNDASVLVIGGDDNLVHIHSIPAGGGDCAAQETIKSPGAITSLTFSPDGQYLAFTDGNRRTCVVRVSDWGPVLDFTYHNARVTCAAWSPDSKRLATGSLDTNLIVWFVEDRAKRIIVKGAHPKSQITGIGWLDDESVISAGQDASLRVWKVSS